MTTIRRASLAVLAILVLEYGIGVYVSLYATVPRADHGAGLATAIAVAAATGASFTSTGEAADSMGMAVMTGVALLCYAANLYLLPRPASPAQVSPAQASTARAGTARGYPAGGGTTGAGKSRL
jgi:hypothetical protein